MERQSEHKSSLATMQDEQATADFIIKMQQQLSAIEKKLDILINQSPRRPMEKSYPQNSPRSFGHSNSYDRQRQDSYPRERTFTRVVCAECNKECEIPFKPSGDRPVYCKDCFSKRKQGESFSPRRDSAPRERDFPRVGRSDSRQAERSQKPVRSKRSAPKKQAGKTLKPAKKKKASPVRKKKRA